MAQDYNETLNLPKTEFPMRASLPAREPDMLKRWYDLGLYEKMLAEKAATSSYVKPESTNTVSDTTGSY